MNLTKNMQLIPSSDNKNSGAIVAQILPLLLFFATVLSGCGSKSTENQSDSSKSNQATLYDEVIDIHDVAMPKLGTISSLKVKIEERIGKMEASNESDEALAPFRRQMDILDQADEDMMGWMRQFEANYEGWDEARIEKYLKEQKEMIATVNSQIDEAIASANALLE